MSAFAPETVRKMAELARLHLSEGEVSQMSAQLDKVLEYVEKLNALDTNGVEPMLSPFDVETPTRSDEVRESPGQEAMLESAPEHLYESYKVPQVIG